MIRLKQIITEQSLPAWAPWQPGKFIKGDKNGKGVVQWHDAKYYGELRNGIPNGQGSLARTKSDGSKWYYKGSFKAGKKDGYGVQTWSDGASYKGSYKAHKKHWNCQHTCNYPFVTIFFGPLFDLDYSSAN